MDLKEKSKMKKSQELVVNLQKMFAAMFLSNIKYQDPTAVLESIVDDNGVGISIYEQKDIGEFFLNFLDRMQDGLGENKSLIRKLMGDEFARQSSINGYTSYIRPMNDQLLEELHKNQKKVFEE
jgi:hypothetical protein